MFCKFKSMPVQAKLEMCDGINTQLLPNGNLANYL